MADVCEICADTGIDYIGRPCRRCRPATPVVDPCHWCSRPAAWEAGPGSSVTFRACDEHLPRLRSIFTDAPNQVRQRDTK